MRIGIFGGSFDPPHRGHLHAARAFAGEARLDKLLIIPAGIPPHKSLSGGILAADRLALCRLAFSEFGDMAEILDLEIKKEGISYTFETLSLLREQYPRDDFFLLVGTDMFLSFEQWREYEKILANCTLCVMHRDEKKEELSVKAEELRKKNGARILLLPQEPYIMSSTEIREEIRARHFSSGLLPSVNSCIELEGLYGADGNDALRRRILDALKERVEPERISHILSVEREVAFLCDACGIRGEEERNIRYAALLHDLTRFLSPGEHLAILGKYGEKASEEDLAIPVSLHSLSGAVLAEKEFGLPHWASEAIRCHTMAKPGMTIPEKILFFADYSEETRPFGSCQSLREEFHSLCGKGDPVALLNECTLAALQGSIDYINLRGRKLHSASLAARDSLIQEQKKGNQ